MSQMLCAESGCVAVAVTGFDFCAVHRRYGKCVPCDGSGKCSTCDGVGLCADCNFSGECIHCQGRGYALIRANVVTTS
jgi:hypothetical protein